MAWRFRKSFKILPGIRLNIGKKGISSLTGGKRGITTTVSRKGIFQNVGIVGTGLSHRGRIGRVPSFAVGLVGLGFAGAVLIGIIALCVLLASVGRNARRHEKTLTSQPIVIPTPLPSPTTVPLKQSQSKALPTARQSSIYIRGPRGGCYFINRNGRKTYVDRSLCN
jgi:hypothetical protein